MEYFFLHHFILRKAIKPLRQWVKESEKNHDGEKTINEQDSRRQDEN